MNNRRILFALLIGIAGLLAACSGAAPTATQDAAASTAVAPTAAPATAEPTIVPTPDPLAVVQSFYDALNAEDFDAVAVLLADNVRWRGTPTMSGKDKIVSFLQASDNESDIFTYDIQDLRGTNGRVTYSIVISKNDIVQGGGEDTVVVEDGLITTFESYAFLGSDARPDIGEVAFSASDSGFSGPEQIDAGWSKLVLSNEGQEPHHIQLVKLDEGKTLDDLTTALASDPENFPAWAAPFGGPNAPDPGGSTSAIVYLEPGNYALIDVIPGADGAPHFANGMRSTLSVGEAHGIPSGEPLPDVTVDLVDFGFTMPATPIAGEQMLRFRNLGSQVHEAYLVRLEAGKTAEDYLNAAPGTPPPAVSIGGITGIVPGVSQYIGVNLEPGNYALFCFFPDPSTHAPHFVQGMIQEFSVK